VAPRVRFAPSPTGHLHVGGARTALFNWLYGRNRGGVFVLRIEDTDQERSSDEMVAGILDSLSWLGLDWDEGPGVGGPYGPYFQAQRFDRHRAAANRLVASGHAYFCYCSPSVLEAERARAQDEGRGWSYARTCRELSREEVDRREAEGRPRAIRFRVPEGRTAFDDVVRGRIEFDNATLEDFVIVRSDGHPTYHLSVVVDDVEMAITDVIRGDDHISNTPKQLLIYQALGAPAPAFAHVPLILGPDKKRLSKRHGATSVGEYRDQGYLPEAMVNFLALLGWSPGGNEEIFTKAELVARFSLDGISGGNAVFNPEKLEWFNQQHLLRMPAREILARLGPELEAAGLRVEALGADGRARLERVVDLVKPRARRITEIVPLVGPFVQESIARDPEAVARYLGAPDLRPHLAAWLDRVGTVEPFAAGPLEAALRQLAGERGIKAGPLIHATRVAVTGQAVSPGVFAVLELMGRERVLRRLTDVLTTCETAAPPGNPQARDHR
jgi:glutamyl-tRNA synthetase